MSLTPFILLIPLIIYGSLALVVFFTIKYFIRYNNKLKNQNKQQEEIQKMNIRDL